MITEMMNQELIAENEKLKIDYMILKNNFEFVLKDNKELRDNLRKYEIVPEAIFLPNGEKIE